MKRTPTDWACAPGSYDTVHAEHIFPSSNDYGIPDMYATPIQFRPPWLAPFRTRIRSSKPLEGAIHFFLDDYRFETVWSRPKQTLQLLEPFKVVLSPGFSLYRDWPVSIQIWNTYRNRHTAVYWQTHGFAVIPTVVWSNHKSYDFAFVGIPQNTVVAIGTIGVNFKDARDGYLFEHGYRTMVERLNPTAVLIYGKMPKALRSHARVYEYPTRWQSIKTARSKRKSPVHVHVPNPAQLVTVQSSLAAD